MKKRSRGARLALVLSGGIGLGVYHAGVYAAVHDSDALTLDWIAGSSVGAVNAAVIAGTAPEKRLDHLRELWMATDAASDRQSAVLAPWRHVQNWSSAVQARVTGVAGHFRPRYMTAPFAPFTSLYDLSPLRTRLTKLIDFERVNSGDIRICVATTDLRSGELVLFDTAEGARITVDHLMASCGYVPEFAPVEIDGRVLGDGGLSVNAPLEAVFLRDAVDELDRVCVVSDLFARDGVPPSGLESALARKNDLLFANQTYMRLQGLQRESVLNHELGRRSGIRAVCYLSYRAPPEEAGPEKTFDLSRQTASERWRAGEGDMNAALSELATARAAARGWSLHVVRRQT